MIAWWMACAQPTPSTDPTDSAATAETGGETQVTVPTEPVALED